MEIVISFEELRAEVFRTELKGRAHVVGEGPFGVGAGDEDHAAAGRFGAVEHPCLDAVLLHRALEQVAQFIVADLADVAGRHAEDGGAGDRIGGGASGNVFDAVFLERIPDAVTGLHVHMLHAAQRQVVFLQQGFIRQDGQDIRQGIADSED